MNRLPLVRCRNGSTLLEAMFAIAIVAIFFAGIYAMNGRAMNMLKQSVECTAATTTLQNRLEKVRASTWEQITDSNYLRDTVLATSSSGGPYLKNLTEQITVNTYPEPIVYSQGISVQSTVIVARAASGTVTTTDAGNGTLAAAKAIRVDVTVSWKPAGASQTQTRQVSTFVSQGGITGRNL